MFALRTMAFTLRFLNTQYVYKVKPIPGVDLISLTSLLALKVIHNGELQKVQYGVPPGLVLGPLFLLSMYPALAYGLKM